MKGMFKKALAGVAAAALAVTGFAAATSTANAAEGDISVEPETITMVGDYEQLAGRRFGYVKLADYVVYEGAGVEGQEGEIDGQLAIDTVDGAVTDAVMAALGETTEYDENTDGDPMTWVANNLNDSDTAPYAGKLRDFVTELVAQLEAKGVAVTEMPAGASTGSSVTYTMDDEPGLYLIIDITGEDDPSYENATSSIPMLVGTRVTGTSENLPTEHINGVVNVKNEITTVEKTVTGGVPGIGDTKSYTITGKVPNWVGKDLTTASYTFTDTPSKGQSVDFSSIKVYVNDVEIPAIDVTQDVVNWQVSGTDKFETPTGVIAADGESSFTIDLTNYLKTAALDKDLIGKEIKVTYDVVINKDALTNPVTNSVVVDNNGSKAESSTSGQTAETPALMRFWKTEADGTTPLAEAEFSLTKTVNGEDVTVKVSEKREGVAGAYVVDPNGTATITSGADGQVTIEGLGEGIYTVTETKAPEGFMQQFKPSFTVTVKADKTTTVVDYTEKSDAWNLISGIDEGEDKVDGNVVVRNVRSVTELPQTGAAGIAMFVVLGLLIAGAGVTVWMKSRGVRNAING